MAKHPDILIIEADRWRLGLSDSGSWLATPGSAGSPGTPGSPGSAENAESVGSEALGGERPGGDEASYDDGERYDTIEAKCQWVAAASVTSRC